MTDLSTTAGQDRFRDLFEATIYNVIEYPLVLDIFQTLPFDALVEPRAHGGDRHIGFGSSRE